MTVLLARPGRLFGPFIRNATLFQRLFLFVRVALTRGFDDRRINHPASHRGGITVRARRGPARATLSALFVGAHPQFNGPSPGSARLDLIIAARYPAGIEWRLRVENLLDARCEEINGYGTPGIGTHFGVTIGLEAP